MAFNIHLTVARTKYKKCTTREAHMNSRSICKYTYIELDQFSIAQYQGMYWVTLLVVLILLWNWLMMKMRLFLMEIYQNIIWHSDYIDGFDLWCRYLVSEQTKWNWIHQLICMSIFRGGLFQSLLLVLFNW